MNKEPKLTAKQFVLQWTGLAISIFLVLSATREMHFIGFLGLIVSSLIGADEQRIAKMLPWLMIALVCYMIAFVGDIYSPPTGTPLLILFRKPFALAVGTFWAVGLSWGYYKWRSSPSDKQP
jgi:hypothetical protein